MLLTGKRLVIDAIRQCRLTAVASPSVCSRSGGYAELFACRKRLSAVTAKIADNERTYMEYKGEMSSGYTA